MAKSKTTEPLHARDYENMDDEAILTQALSDMRASESFQSQYFDKFRRYYKLYRSFISLTDRKPDRSNLFIPYTFAQIETIVPKIVLGMFTSRPYVQTMPLGFEAGDRELRAQKMNKLLEYQFQQKIRLVQIATDAIKAVKIYGTAITKQTWEFKTKRLVKRKQREILGMKIPGAFEDVLVESVVKDDPNITLVPILDFFFDPAATTIEEARYCIHRYWEDYNEIAEKAKNSKGIYKNLDKIKDADKGSSVKEDADMLDAIGISAATNKKKGIEILEVWTDDWVVKIADKSVVIYSQMNPFFHHKKPFAKWIDSSVPNEFYGIGSVEAIEPLQNELNTTRNQRIDNVSFVLNKMYKINRGANIDTKQLVSRPAGFIEVDEMSDVEELKFTDVTSSSYNEETYIKQDIDVATGVHDTERGSSPERRETATTMNILANAGSERFKLQILLTEYGGLHDTVNQIVQLNQQYIDRPKEILLLGNAGQIESDIISPEEILGQYTIVAVGSAVEPKVNKEQYQAQITQLFTAVSSSPEVNRPELLKIMFEAFDIKNAESLINKVDPMQQLQQMIAQQQQNPLQTQNSEV